MLLASGMSRREFLHQSTVAAFLMRGLLDCKPAIAKDLRADSSASNALSARFSKRQRNILRTVQLQLFPADGDGPSAEDLHALAYLQWALTDPDNLEDGDRAFIARGISWLEELSRQEYNNDFHHISGLQQHRLLEKVSNSAAGENWMSLLIYYLLEALLLDPVYGGNPDGIGWKWLQHQPGFPRTDKTHGYRRYQG